MGNTTSNGIGDHTPATPLDRACVFVEALSKFEQAMMKKHKSSMKRLIGKTKERNALPQKLPAILNANEMVELAERLFVAQQKFEITEMLALCWQD